MSVPIMLRACLCLAVTLILLTLTPEHAHAEQSVHSHAARPSYRLTEFHSHARIHSTHQDDIITKHRKKLPFGWSKLDVGVSNAYSKSQLINLTIALKWAEAEKLEELFWTVSDPSHPSYTRYPSFKQLTSLITPHRHSRRAVKEYLLTNGISADSISYSPLKDYLTARVSVLQAEQLLNTTYHVFRHASTGRERWGTLSYSYPASLSKHIDFMTPTLHLPSQFYLDNNEVLQKKKAPGKTVVGQEGMSYREEVEVSPVKEQANRVASHVAIPNDRPACSPFIDIPCLNWLYNTQGYVASSNTNSSTCATGFLGQYIAGSDISNFMQWFAPQYAYMTVHVIGPNDQSNPGGEATQDVQLLMGMGPNTQVVFWSTPGSEPHGPEADEPFLKFLIDASNAGQLPYIISTSYGDDELDLDIDYVNRVNQHFQLLGLRGVSVLFASGDGGVAGGHGIPGCKEFVAVFPGASPYVTSCGGTEMKTPTSAETGAAFSSGGFSNYWSRPHYQDAAVNNYLTKYGKNLPDPSRYNRTGRAFPDVAAISYNLPTVLNGGAWPTMGTSCSAPIISALMALLNDFRFNHQLNSLGFLNQWLYSLPPDAFNDITVGNNPGCNTGGFYCSQFWDPVTGLGSPNVLAMSKYMSPTINTPMMPHT